MARILLVSQDELLVGAYAAKLTREGFEIEHCASGYEGLSKARHGIPDLIILDLALAGIHGLTVLKFLRDVPWLLKVHVVLLIESTIARETLNECLLWGAGSYLQKDRCSLNDMVSHVQDVMCHISR